MCHVKCSVTCFRVVGDVESHKSAKPEAPLGCNTDERTRRKRIPGTGNGLEKEWECEEVVDNMSEAVQRLRQ